MGLWILSAGLCEKLVLSDIDERIFALWRTTLDHPKWLASKIESFRPSRRALLHLLESTPNTYRDLAFQTLVRNRTSRGGLISSGAGLLKRGERENGVFSRWYPETLIARIFFVSSMRDQIELFQRDGFELIRSRRTGKRNFFFVDPPYSLETQSAGRRLYDHHELRHYALLDLLSTIKSSFLLTHEDSRQLRRQARDLGLSYSPVSMRSSHHKKCSELLIRRVFH